MIKNAPINKEIGELEYTGINRESTLSLFRELEFDKLTSDCLFSKPPVKRSIALNIRNVRLRTLSAYRMES